MSPVFDCSDPAQLLPGMRQARQAIARGELVVMPTDTVYGVAADAFSPAAVARLLAAKGRGRQSPPPVLVSGVDTLRALAAEVPEPVERLVAEFWPGGLTIVLPAQPSLAWDLGDTDGTVAVRMPEDQLALELLTECGPLAVSSANVTGWPAAIAIDEARDMLGDAVAVYLDGGISRTGIASTIVDASGLAAGRPIAVLRQGAIPRAALARVLGDLLEPEAPPEAQPTPGPDPAPQPAPDPAPQSAPAPEQNPAPEPSAPSGPDAVDP
ncbi:MAG: L-threonylcarbamoyladenylate synthase [Microbacterium sp.]